MPRTWRPKWAELAVVALILGGLAWLVLPVVLAHRGRAGRPIPPGPPSESRRLRHPAGFSIVVPPDWDVWPSTLRADSPYLMLAPHQPGPYARRSTALLQVTRLPGGPREDLADFRPTRFRGRPAFERMAVERQGTFDDPAWSEYVAYVDSGRKWFEFRYGIAEERVSLPQAVQSYLNTLSWDGGDAIPAGGP